MDQGWLCMEMAVLQSLSINEFFILKCWRLILFWLTCRIMYHVVVWVQKRRSRDGYGWEWMVDGGCNKERQSGGGFDIVRYC